MGYMLINPNCFVWSVCVCVWGGGSTPSHACNAGQNLVAALLLAADSALLVSAPALAQVTGETAVSKMAA